MEKKNYSIGRIGLTSILVIFLLFSSLTWAQDNTQTNTGYGSTVTIAGPFTALPDTDYEIILIASTDVSIYQWSLSENGVTIAGSGFTFGSQLNQTLRINKPAGSYTYLFRFRGIAGAHGFPPYTEASITVNVVTPQPPTIWYYKVTGPNNSDSVQANIGDVVYFELDATAPDYVWGNIIVLYDTSKLESVSIEEDPNNYYGFWAWWTDATGNPVYSGGGNYYYYDQIKNTAIFGLGSDWAQQWVSWYGDGNAGSVGTIDPTYGQTLSNKLALAERVGIPLADVDKFGAIRLYTSTYAGGNGTSPLRLGFRLLSRSAAIFHAFADGSPDRPIGYGWGWNHLDSYLKSSVRLLPLPAPAAPSNLVATAISSSQINLTWQHNATDAKEYVVERKDNYQDYAPIAWVSLLSDSETPGLQVNYSDSGLTQDTTYSYRVQCYNETGNSDYSNEADALTWLEAPSNLSTNSASISQVDISWTNNSPAAEGFTVERMDVYHKFIPIATVGYGVTSYSDTGLEQNTRYNYRVQAFRTGNTSDYSQESYGDTLQRTIGYIIDLLSHYYQNGQIRNQGIYNSLVSKLQSAQDAMMHGDWNAYQNKMQAAINELEAQAGKGVEHQAAEELKQESKATKEQKPEIKGADGKSDPLPFLPVCFPVSFTVVLPSINGTWSVTATDGAGVDIQGGSGTITPSGPVTRTITVHARQNNPAINIIITVIPNRGAPITGTLPAPIPAIPTDFTNVNPVIFKSTPPPTKITPTATGGITIAGPTIFFVANAKISTTDIGAAYVDTWVLGFLQNVISHTTRHVYSPPTPPLTLESQLKPGVAQSLDQDGPDVPMTNTGSSRAFSSNNQPQSVNNNDTPSTENIGTQSGNTTLSEFYARRIFITWLIAKNRTTGEIRYLYWWKWEHIQHIVYNSVTREAIKQPDTGIVHDPSQDRGFGNGTDITRVTPKTDGPLANTIVNKEDNWVRTVK